MNGVEQMVSDIREFACRVDAPDDWRIVVPVDEYNDVVEQLDTTKEIGRYYQGISICYSDKVDQVRVKRNTPVSEYLRSLHTDTDRKEDESND